MDGNEISRIINCEKMTEEKDSAMKWPHVGFAHNIILLKPIKISKKLSYFRSYIKHSSYMHYQGIKII